MNDSILYPIIKEGKYGFVNMQGELVVSPKYDLVGRFVENRCSVEVFQDDFTKLIGYIDSSGQEVIPLRPAKYSSSFSEGLAQISGDLKKLGYIDKNGKFIIPPHFLIEFEGEKSLGFSEGIAATLGGLILTKNPVNGHLENYGKLSYITVIIGLICIWIVRKIQVNEEINETTA